MQVKMTLGFHYTSLGNEWLNQGENAGKREHLNTVCGM
jgi:hypothetical protein